MRPYPCLWLLVLWLLGWSMPIAALGPNRSIRDDLIRIRAFRRATLYRDRDEHGTPVVLGGDLEDIFACVRYIHALDRLWQVFLRYAAVNGRLAEFLGPGPGRIHVELDRHARTFLYTEQELDVQFQAGPATQRHRVDIYWGLILRHGQQITHIKEQITPSPMSSRCLRPSGGRLSRAPDTTTSISPKETGDDWTRRTWSHRGSSGSSNPGGSRATIRSELEGVVWDRWTARRE